MGGKWEEKDGLWNMMLLEADNIYYAPCEGKGSDSEGRMLAGRLSALQVDRVEY